VEEASGRRTLSGMAPIDGNTTVSHVDNHAVPIAHLAQVNAATLLAPMDHPATADFASGLDPVNAAGEAAPGYIWRLQSDSGNATDIQMYDNPLAILNLTVWDSVDSLRAFAFGGIHRDFLRRRNEWFDPATTRTAMWWLPAGDLPTAQEAVDRLDFVAQFGDSPYAFQFRSPSAAGAPQLLIRRATIGDADAATLIGELNAELSEMYPEPGANHFTLSAADVASGSGGFFVATVDGELAGCAAYRHLGDGRSEVKRMYTRRTVRGLKLGAALLHHVVCAARAEGATTMVLETGRRQNAAMGLYERYGFAECPCWGEYLDSIETSLCMSLPLSTRATTSPSTPLA
jgi:GNAT superfamily N-acetyltransferase